MITRLNHVAIAVPDIGSAATKYRETLGAEVSEPQDLPDHGVTVVFVEVGNTKIELITPLGQDSPLSNYMRKNPGGGIHHLCLEVPDIATAAEDLGGSGVRIIGDGKPSIGAHGKPVLFLHPKEFDGALIELEEA